MTWGDVATVVITALVGVGAGMLSALLGVGGAVITTPAVRVLGATPIQAVGSTVPAILPGAIAGTLRYAREGLVDWRAALGLGLSGSVVAVVGALVSDHVPGELLMLLTAVLMLWSGFVVARGGHDDGPMGDGRDGDGAAGIPSSRADDGALLEMLDGAETFEADTAFDWSGSTPGRAPGPASGGDPTDAVTDERASRRRHPLPLLIVLGAAAGFVAGLLGVGGGIVIMPVLTGPLRIPMKEAVASSLVAVAIFSVPTLVTHALLGHIDWTYALPLMVGVVPGARIGARLTIGASERTVRRLFGVMIVVLAVVYGVTEVVHS